MRIRVDYQELKNKSTELNNEIEQLQSEINNLKENLENVKLAWQGVDSENFVGKADAYYTNMNQIVYSLKAFSSFAASADDNYYNGDKKWKDDVEKAGVNFGRDEKKLINQ